MNKKFIRIRIKALTKFKRPRYAPYCGCYNCFDSYKKF